MNRDETRAAAQVMMAAADGKMIETRNRCSNQGWSDCVNYPTWDWVNTAYRVKKRSGTHWLVIGPYGECHQAYQTEDDARAHVLGDTSLIAVKAEWVEE